MDVEQRVLCLAARTHLSSAVEAQLRDALCRPIDWQHLWTLARLHQVWPLIDLNFQRLNNLVAIPPEWIERFHADARATLFDNGLMGQQLLRVLKALEAAGVKAIPFKGIIIAAKVYGNLALRPAADLDVLVRRHDLPASRSVLQSLGFVQDPNPDFGHLRHALHDPPYSYHVGRRHVELDLHWTLWAQHLFPLDIDLMWKQAVSSEFGGATLRLLSPEDTLLHLAIHRSRAALRLRLVCDIAELLRRSSTTLDWDYVIRQAHHGGARTALYNGLWMANELLGAPLPAGILPCLGISALKQRILDTQWGVQALFRPPTSYGSVQELSRGQRFVMLDDTRQVRQALGYRTARGAKYLRSLVTT